MKKNRTVLFILVLFFSWVQPCLAESLKLWSDTPSGRVDLSTGGTAFLNGIEKTFLEVTHDTAREWKVTAIIANDEDATPTLNGLLSSNDWVTLRISEENTLGKTGFVSVFDPYNLPFDDQFSGTVGPLHVLRPGEYPFHLDFFGLSCAEVTLPCEFPTSSHTYKIIAYTIPEPLFGDANLDGKVAFDDFLTLSQNFTGDPFEQSRGWTYGDFNQNGSITNSDFRLLSRNYGREHQSPVAVPEPRNLHLVLVLLMVSLAARGSFRR